MIALPGFSLSDLLDLQTSARGLVALLPSPREWFLVAAVTVALMAQTEGGRKRLAMLARGRSPRSSAAGRTDGRSGLLGDRWFLLIAIATAAGVAAWVATLTYLGHSPPR